MAEAIDYFLIQNLLNRKFEEEEPDPEEYLARLMGQA